MADPVVNVKTKTQPPDSLLGLRALRISFPEYKDWNDSELMSGLRTQYPEYKDWSNEELDISLSEKYGSLIPAEDKPGGLIQEAGQDFKDFSSEMLELSKKGPLAPMIGSPINRGLAKWAVSLPSAVGGLVQEAGERLGEDPVAGLPGIMGDINQTISNVGKYIAEKTQVDEFLTKTGKNLIKKNQELVRKVFPQTDNKVEKFLEDLGSGAGSLATAVGVSIVTKSPSAAAVVFGAIQKGSFYTEAREAGLSPEHAGNVSTAAGVAETVLEKVGLDFMLKKFNNRIFSFAIKAGSEALQEGLQTGSEAGIADIVGIREDSAKKVAGDMLYSGVLGALTGGGASIMLDGQGALSEAGLNENQVAGTTKIIQNKIKEESQEIAKDIENTPLQALSPEDESGLSEALTVEEDILNSGQGSDVAPPSQGPTDDSGAVPPTAPESDAGQDVVEVGPATSTADASMENEVAAKATETTEKQVDEQDEHVGTWALYESELSIDEAKKLVADIRAGTITPANLASRLGKAATNTRSFAKKSLAAGTLADLLEKAIATKEANPDKAEKTEQEIAQDTIDSNNESINSLKALRDGEEIKYKPGRKTHDDVMRNRESSTKVLKTKEELAESKRKLNEVIDKAEAENAELEGVAAKATETTEKQVNGQEKEEDTSPPTAQIFTEEEIAAQEPSVVAVKTLKTSEEISSWIEERVVADYDGDFAAFEASPEFAAVAPVIDAKFQEEFDAQFDYPGQNFVSPEQDQMFNDAAEKNNLEIVGVSPAVPGADVPALMNLNETDVSGGTTFVVPVDATEEQILEAVTEVRDNFEKQYNQSIDDFQSLEDIDAWYNTRAGFFGGSEAFENSQGYALIKDNFLKKFKEIEAKEVTEYASAENQIDIQAIESRTEAEITDIEDNLGIERAPEEPVAPGQAEAPAGAEAVGPKGIETDQLIEDFAPGVGEVEQKLGAKERISTFRQVVLAQGGLKAEGDLAGEVTRVGKGIIRKTGKTIDQMVERLNDIGYFIAGPSELLDFLNSNAEAPPLGEADIEAFNKREQKKQEQQIPPEVKPKPKAPKKIKEVIAKKKAAAKKSIGEANTKKEIDQAVFDIMESKGIESDQGTGTFSARKKDIESSRKALGQDGLPSKEKQRFREWLQEAVDKGIPEKALDMATDIVQNPQSLAPFETAGFDIAVMRLQNKHKILNNRLKNTTDKVEESTITTEMQRIEAEHDILTRALGVSTSEAGRRLVASKLEIDLNYELLPAKTMMKVLKGAELTKTESEKLEKAIEMLDTTNKEIEALKATVKDLSARRVIKETSARKYKSMNKIQKDVELSSLMNKAKQLFEDGCHA